MSFSDYYDVTTEVAVQETCPECDSELDFNRKLGKYSTVFDCQGCDFKLESTLDPADGYLSDAEPKEEREVTILVREMEISLSEVKETGESDRTGVKQKICR